MSKTKNKTTTTNISSSSLYIQSIRRNHLTDSCCRVGRFYGREVRARFKTLGGSEDTRVVCVTLCSLGAVRGGSRTGGRTRGHTLFERPGVEHGGQRPDRAVRVSSCVLSAGRDRLRRRYGRLQPGRRCCGFDRCRRRCRRFHVGRRQFHGIPVGKHCYGL